jgi:hypothetical protein
MGSWLTVKEQMARTYGIRWAKAGYTGVIFDFARWGKARALLCKRIPARGDSLQNNCPWREVTLMLRFFLAIFAATCLSTVSAQERPDTAPTGVRPALIREMSGTWRVEQRMWTDAGTQPLALPPAIARRRLVEGGFVEEIMEKLPQAEGDTFTRIAYLNFNAVTGQFEYVSLDSRLPLMMTERSRAPRSRQ